MSRTGNISQDSNGALLKNKKKKVIKKKKTPLEVK